jgi:hypothetical protein
MHARGRKKTSEGLHGCAVGAILHPNAIKRANKRLRVLHHYVKGVKSFHPSAPCSSATCERVVEKKHCHRAHFIQIAASIQQARHKQRKLLLKPMELLYKSFCLQSSV